MFFISIIPYVPLPRFNSFLEQRYYYTPNIFAAVLLTVVADFYIDILKFFKYRHIFSIAIIGIILFHNYFTLQEDLRNKVALASVRKNILFQFKKELPVLPAKKNVFYVTGNGKDYLMEGAGLKVPFQSGFGNVLMIWYFDKNKITPGLLDDAFLYQLADQGYKQIGQSGFGYYFQRKKLLNDLHKKKFSVDNVLSFYWDVSSKKLLQTTISERKELMKEIQK